MNQRRNGDRRLLPVCAGALAAAMIAPPAQADSLGRLFFTPEQRAQLDQVRMRAAAEKAGSAAPGKTDAIEIVEVESGPPSVLTVNGIVQKRGGGRTVWINGVAQNADSSGELAPESMAVTVPGKVPGKMQPARVKVGQQLLLDSPPRPKPAERKPVADSGED